jgi:hypothetical protein
MPPRPSSAGEVTSPPHRGAGRQRHPLPGRGISNVFLSNEGNRLPTISLLSLISPSWHSIQQARTYSLHICLASSLAHLYRDQHTDKLRIGSIMSSCTYFIGIDLGAGVASYLCTTRGKQSRGASPVCDAN